MKKDFKYREIPYNYTSFSDKEIILKYFDEETWDILNELRNQRVTGRSAKLLFEMYGDYFIIDRNPYIYNNFLDKRRKLRKLEKLHNMRLGVIEKGAQKDSPSKDLVLKLIEKTRKVKENFFSSFEEHKQRRKKLYTKLSMITRGGNIYFSAFHKVSHATDATDWRVEYPEVVVYPDTIDEMRKLVQAAKSLNLKIIARGGGTGLTGGAIPVYKNTMIINTEKMTRIGQIEMIGVNGIEIPVIEAECGVVNQDVKDYCRNQGYIFATDPTSAWACTIGGNIAENAGGKKAVIWGTTIDNLFSFRVINANGDLIEVRRRNHPHRKILHDDEVIFDIYKIDKKEYPNLIKTITMAGTDVRKKGLGKDITNKALKGVPGIQKEGGDGIIVSGKFVLYKHFKNRETICLEFFGNNMINASKAIVDIKNLFGPNTGPAYLTALEHFDDKYISAINYRNKSARREVPKAVLLIDVESNDKNILDEYTTKLLDMVKIYNTEGIIALDDFSRDVFWQDRKKLSAIAKHTNAFKINEDVVITVDRLPVFSDFVDHMNVQKDLTSYLTIIDDVDSLLQSEKSNYDDGFFPSKVDNFLKVTERLKNTYQTYLNNLDSPAREILHEHQNLELNNETLFHVIQDGKILIDFNQDLVRNLRDSFHGYDEVIEKIDEGIRERNNKKVVVATHMHAGDGNIHVNIPVHSSDYQMMLEADETAATVINKTKELGGVISGEHGIGLTKLRFLDKEILDDYAKHKDEVDPDDIFNPGKLRANFPMHLVYTPSFNLLELEAFILTASDLEQLSMSIAPCLRCGRCKPVCNTHYPQANMFYNPRNKIQGVALIMEAVLYDAQTSNELSFRHFKMLRDISDHCTLCHKCETPCPVDIDFGEVTLAIRKLLVDRKKKTFKFITWMTLYYLRKRGFYFNKIMRLAYLKLGFTAQKIGHYFNKPISKITKYLAPKTNEMLLPKYPDAGQPTIRDLLNLKGQQTFFVFQNPDKNIKKSVLYFPGCGSERMFPDISMATIALLYYGGVQVIIPPEYLCCGFPLKANGQTQMVELKSYENRVIFHRMADTIGYIDIKHTIVSCGTCYEMLDTYELENIFEGSSIIEITEFVRQENLYEMKKSETPLLYHEPCHSPMKKYGHNEIFQTFYGSKPVTTPNCCGDGGTLALSTPHISNQLRERKAGYIKDTLPVASNKATVLTTCPSCVQGLSKIDNGIKVTGKHHAVHMMENLFGKNWQKKFIKDVKKGGLERVLM